MASSKPLDLEPLTSRLAELGRDLDDAWPTRSLRAMIDAGVPGWFLPRAWGGQEWTTPAILAGYVQLGAACLTSTFILTQWAAACKRLLTGDRPGPRERWLPRLLTGQAWATVGISHLTTSRQHLQDPILKARPAPTGSDALILDGLAPWVTGGAHADLMLVGAVDPDAGQYLLAVPGDRQGVHPGSAASLVALSASQTGAVRFDNVRIEPHDIVAGPDENVMGPLGGGAGGLPTSALALGLTRSALDFLHAEGEKRPELLTPFHDLQAEFDHLQADLLALGAGQAPATPGMDVVNLRAQANSLVLRTTQSALIASKGAGYLTKHPAGRWCQEALFFLVWSCPASVVQTNLCQLSLAEV